MTADNVMKAPGGLAPDHTGPTAVELQRRLTMLHERNRRKSDVLLIAAYHAAKGLTELLGAMDPRTLSAAEIVAVADAHHAALQTFRALNQIVIDHGQAPSPLPE